MFNCSAARFIASASAPRSARHSISKRSGAHWRFEQLNIPQPDFASSLDNQVQLDQVWSLPLLQVKGDLVGGPVARALSDLVQSLREEFPASCQTTPHLQEGPAS